MDSKKSPLWLVFTRSSEAFNKLKNPPNSPITGGGTTTTTTTTTTTAVLYKTGDDLRQDILTLQLLNMMDYIWLSNQLNLNICSYSVIATGLDCGMIDVVAQAYTTSNIQMCYGGNAWSAWKNGPLNDFLYFEKIH